MRRVGIVLLALVAAVLGGVSVLAVGKSGGWLSTQTRRTTVVVQAPNVVGPDAASRTTTVADSARPLAGNGFDPARIYARRSAGVVTIYSVYGSTALAEEAQGSGFVVSPKGYILTNSHVITTAGDSNSGTVKAASRVYVEFDDRDRVSAKVVGWDVFDDVGLIKVDPADHALDPVPLGDSDKAIVGEPVAAIGSPFGNEDSLSVGVVSATKRSIPALTSDYNVVDAIQTDAPINHGNSGGPMFDARGRVIGINAQIRSESGNAEGVGFAIPINSAKRSMEQLAAAGRVSYAYVGVETEDLTPSVAQHFGYPVKQGAVVTTVRGGTPASKAGLRGGNHDVQILGTRFTTGGDLIVAIDGTSVGSAEDVVRIVTEDLSPGQTATFTIVRNGKRRDVKVTLAERPTNPNPG